MDNVFSQTEKKYVKKLFSLHSKQISNKKVDWHINCQFAPVESIDSNLNNETNMAWSVSVLL